MTDRQYRIESDPTGNGTNVYGGNYGFLKYQRGESLIHGPAETGKTFAMCLKIHLCACKYPGSTHAIIRKTQTSCYNTVVRTFMDKILGRDVNDWPCEAYGGVNKPERFNYRNGSTVYIGGIDKASKILSAEFDLIAVNQTEELSLSDWETCTTRTTGRAGNMPYSQTIGDANPAWPTHWMYSRESLKMHYSEHRDNPALYDQQTGDITRQGEHTMSVLEALTGLRRIRLLEGKPAQAEGVIYGEYHPGVHLIDRFDIPGDWLRFRSIDFGYTNPFVCQWWAVDGDGRMYRYREIYQTGRTVKTHAAQINALTTGRISETVCDHDAEDRATLAENGIRNSAAKKAVAGGIGKVKDRLNNAGDGKPRIFLLRDSLVEVDETLKADHLPTCTEEEFPSYVWANSKTKEAPGKENDHGMDALRYAVMHLDWNAKHAPAGNQAAGVELHKRGRPSRWRR